MALLIVEEERGARERRTETGPDWQQTLDFIEVGIVFPLLYAYLFLVPGEWQSLAGLSLWGFFGFSDVENWFLVAAFVARAALCRNRERRALYRWLIPYLIVYALGSSAYNFANSLQGLQTGSWHDLLFTLALTLGSLLAAVWKEIEPSEATDFPAIVSWAPAALPLITVTLALPMVRHEPTLSVIAVSASIMCLGARLLVTLHRRQRLMEALFASESRYAGLVRMAPDAIFVHAGGRIIFANPATARILGYADADAMVGRMALDFVAPEQKDEVLRVLASLSSEAAARQLVCVRTDGTRVRLDAVGMTLTGSASADAAMPRLVIARDVTDRDHAEAERESLIRDLEAKNAELERFTYTVSHDLRGPLITILGFLKHVEDAASRSDLDALRSDVNRIRQATVRMDRLLKDLLELSRTGHVLAPRESAPFHEVVQEALDRVRGRLSARGVTVDIAPDLPIVHGDRARLTEVVQNLVDNAAKFMGGQKEPRIEIGARRAEGEDRFFVRDNGMGIEPRFQERVFGLFDKLDPQADGTGVGLALVKRIIELHSGRIWVESEGREQGSTFWFTLGS
jgi:PAS domain S-box-containing protein